MNTLISAKDLRELAAVNRALRGQQDNNRQPVISIYMPTHKAGAEVLNGQDSIRLKNLLQQARREVLQAGYPLSEEQLQQLLAPAEALIANSSFWRYRSQGLALFIGENLFSYFEAPDRFDEKVIVDNSCYLLPLLPLLNEQASYFILAVSQHHVRLLEASRYHIVEVPLGKEVPHSIEEALKYDDYEKEDWFNNASGIYIYNFYGYGGGQEVEYKNEILRYFQDMREGLNDKLFEKKLPLLYAGLDFSFPIFKEACTYPYLIKDRHIGINPNPERPESLLEKSLPLMESYLHQSRQQAQRQIESLAGTGRTSENPQEIVLAALEGRVEVLFAKDSAQLWGSIAPESREVQPTEAHGPQTQELVNLAARETLLMGGQVFVNHQEALPAAREEALMMALLRY